MPPPKPSQLQLPGTSNLRKMRGGSGAAAQKRSGWQLHTSTRCGVEEGRGEEGSAVGPRKTRRKSVNQRIAPRKTGQNPAHPDTHAPGINPRQAASAGSASNTHDRSVSPSYVRKCDGAWVRARAWWRGRLGSDMRRRGCVWFLFLVLGPWVFEPHQQASQLGLCVSVWAKSRGNCCLHPTAEYTGFGCGNRQRVGSISGGLFLEYDCGVYHLVHRRCVGCGGVERGDAAVEQRGYDKHAAGVMKYGSLSWLWSTSFRFSCQQQRRWAPQRCTWRRQACAVSTMRVCGVQHGNMHGAGVEYADLRRSRMSSSAYWGDEEHGGVVRRDVKTRERGRALSCLPTSPSV
ncbi:hypothetical protein FB45DRAFT_1001345 [Roridomyces roridus]|uniref:Uncharacterized protein n=1 Tax=Roridomyces roridus TaxID=1738132 RepID=A0AAD7C5X8_9AGAR|nr:hypothetical protein FB45DRAFT_1001345 [Roridomyces roridus]